MKTRKALSTKRELAKNFQEKNRHTLSQPSKPGKVSRCNRKRMKDNLKLKRNSDVYRATHAVGRRASSHFVTYTQNGRLFYDLYARESPYCQFAFSPKYSQHYNVDQKTDVKKSKAKASRFSSTSKYRRKSNAASQSVLSKKCKREASLNASIKLGIMCSSTSRISASSVVPKSERRLCKGKKTSRRTLDVNDSRSKVDKKLKRELGSDYLLPDTGHGKRLASLNAVAIMDAFKKDYKRVYKCQYTSQRQSSVATLPCKENGPTNPALVDDLDDTNTEPMCENLDVPSHILKSISVHSHVPLESSIFPYNVTEKKVPDFTTAHPPAPAIESFHSQRIIPFGHDSFGLQQITHQFVFVPPSTPYCSGTSPHIFNREVTYSNPQHLPYSGALQQTLHFSNSPGVDDMFNLRPLNMLCTASLNPFYQVPNNNTWQSITPSFPAPQFIPFIGFQPHTIINNVPPNGPFYPQLASNAYPIFLQPMTPNSNAYLSQTAPLGLFAPVLYSYPFTYTNPAVCQNVCRDQLSKTTLALPLLQPAPIPIQNVFSSPCVSNVSYSSVPLASFPCTNVCSINEPTNTSMTSQSNSSTNVKSVTDPLGSFTQLTTPSVNSNLSNLVDTANDPRVDLLPKFIGACDIDEEINNPFEPRQKLMDTGGTKDAWNWEGSSYTKFVFCQMDAPPKHCECYPAIRHRVDGMIIREKDSVLLCSGPDRSHPPHVAKVTALFLDKNTGTKMMSLLWYYRPEHLTGAVHNGFVKNELYASRHRDINPVDCIEDKAFVLPVSAYSRFMAKIKYQQAACFRKRLNSIVPESSNCSLHNSVDNKVSEISSSFCEKCLENNANDTNLFFCRGLYDYKLKRVYRSPSFGVPIPTSNFCTTGLLGRNRNTFATTGPDFEMHSTRIGKRNFPLTRSCDDNLNKMGQQLAEKVPLQEKNEYTSKLEVVSCSPSPSVNNTINGAAHLTHKSSQLQKQLNRLIFSDDRKSKDSSRGARTSTPIRKLNSHFSQDLGDKMMQTINFSTSLNTTNLSHLGNIQDGKICPNTLATTVPRYVPSQPNAQNLNGTTNTNVNITPLIRNTESIVSTPITTHQSTGELSSPAQFPIVTSQWSPVTSLNGYDSRSVLDTSADLSVNWGEHGEQIALSLDCRVKEQRSSINEMEQPTLDHLNVQKQFEDSSQVINMTQLSVPSTQTMHYTSLPNAQSHEQDSHCLIML